MQSMHLLEHPIEPVTMVAQPMVGPLSKPLVALTTSPISMEVGLTPCPKHPFKPNHVALYKPPAKNYLCPTCSQQDNGIHDYYYQPFL